MRLLLPNARNSQAYAVARSLRAEAKRIVALAEHRYPLAQYLAHCAYAPEVDRVISTGWPLADWERGNHRATNTPPEQAYVDVAERACVEERIEWIFPSLEGSAYVFAKNRARFERLGVSLVCAPLDVVQLVNDKFRSMHAVVSAGLPAPRTLNPGPDAVDDAGRTLGYPLVVKPSYSSASRGVFVVRDLAGLREAYSAVVRYYGGPVVQQYIPGPLDGAFLRVIGVADASSNVVGLHVARTLLTLFRNSNLPPAVARSETNPEVAALTARAVKALRITGPFLVQYKVDRRDGVARILEVNCKLSYRVWTAIADGLDVPRLALEVATHGTTKPVGPTRTGSVFVNVPEWFLARRLSRDRARPVAEVVRDGPTVLDPYAQEFFRRPRVAAVWWSTFLGFAVKEQLKRRLGRLMHPVLGPHA